MEIEEALVKSFDKLIETTSQATGKSLVTAIAEMEINGVHYQVQLSFIADKKGHIGPNEIMVADDVWAHTRGRLNPSDIN